MNLSSRIDVSNSMGCKWRPSDMKAYMDDHSKPDSWIYSSMVMSYSSTANVLGAEGILNVMEVGLKQLWPPSIEFECLDCIWPPAT